MDNGNFAHQNDVKRLTNAVHNLSHILAQIIADNPQPLIDGLTKQEALTELKEIVHDQVECLILSEQKGQDFPKGDNSLTKGKQKTPFLRIVN